MTFLLDSNILLRSADPGHTQHRAAVDAVEALALRGHARVLVPQNLYEFWTVATRPVADNGLGMTPDEAAVELSGWKARFPMLPDTPAVYPVWERLVIAHGVRGKPTHDVRLVAAMEVHGVTRLLTFNAKHFLRFPSVTAVTPADVLQSPP